MKEIRRQREERGDKETVAVGPVRIKNNINYSKGEQYAFKYESVL